MAPSPPLRLAGRAAAVALLVAGAAGCVPYAVGSTARTVAPRQVAPSAVVQIASAQRALDTDDVRPGGAVASVGNEARLGLDARSDVGLRVHGLGSVTATYKRRLAGTADAGTAVVVGAGVVGASHLHWEATLVAALPARGRVQPYGGVRVQDLAPFADGARDVPVAVGVFAGARLGWPDLALAPEVGLFRSPSPLVGDASVVVVPSVTVSGDRLMRALGL